MKKLTGAELVDEAKYYRAHYGLPVDLGGELHLVLFFIWLRSRNPEPAQPSITELLQQHLESLESNTYRFQPDGTHRIGNEINKVKQAMGLIKELQRGKEEPSLETAKSIPTRHEIERYILVEAWGYPIDKVEKYDLHNQFKLRLAKVVDIILHFTDWKHDSAANG